MPLINCKVKLKLKWTKRCIFAAGRNDKDDANSNNMVLFSKTKLYVPVVTLLAKDNQKLSKLLSKGFERLYIGMNIKQKERIKI